MAKYRKKPVVIEAERFDGSIDKIPFVLPWHEIPGGLMFNSFESDRCDTCGRSFDRHGWVKTLEGGHIACPGDMIITGVQGEHYPCKPDIFNQTYELVSEGEE